MPAIDSVSNRSAQPKRKKVKRPAVRPPTSKPKVTVAPADRVSERVEARKTQIRQSVSKSPDRQDTKRTPAQQKRDTAVVAENVKTSRAKVVKRQRSAAIDAQLARKLREKKVSKTVAPVAPIVAPVKKILEQTTRPLHAIAAATDEAIHGGKVRGPGSIGTASPTSVLKAAGRGALNKDKTTFGDVVEHAGVKNKAISSTVGFGLDVVFDPVTHGRAEVASAAEHAAEKASRKAERAAVKSAPAKVASEKASQQAVKTGASPKQAKQAGKTAARKHARRAGQKAGEKAAEGKSTHRGISVKVAGREVPGVTRATATVGRGAKAVVPQGVRDSARDTAATFSTNVRPSGVDRAEYAASRRNARTARAGLQSGVKDAGDRAIAFRKAIGDKEYARVLDAIETGAIRSLSKELRQPARLLERDFARMRKRELKHGLKVGDVTKKGKKADDSPPMSKAEREDHAARLEEQAAGLKARAQNQRDTGKYAFGMNNEVHLDRLAAGLLKEAEKVRKVPDAVKEGPVGYVKHLRIRDKPRPVAPSVGSKKVNPGFGKSRIEGTLQEKLAKEPGAYSTDIPEIYLNRGAESAVAISKAKLNQSMLNAGRRPDRGAPIDEQLGKGETLYKVDGANLVKIDHKSTEAKTLPRGGKYVILNDKVVDRTYGTLGRAADRTTPGVFFDKATGVWKLASTQVNPGYHVRNLAGEGQNAYAAERNVVVLGRNTVQAARALKQLGRDEEARRVLGAKPKEGPHTDFIRTARSVGAVRAGQVGREIGDMLKSTSADRPRPKVRRGTFRRPGRALKNVEDVFRLATYKGGLDRGLSPEKAMERAAGHHFDYADLTPTERVVMRRLMPFWTFSARNIPLQAKVLMTDPKKFANYQKIREEMQNAFGIPDDWQKDLNESEQRSAPFPVKIGGKTYNISLGPSGLPITDLNEFPVTTDPVKQADEWMNRAMSMLHPLPKTSVELWSNMSFFFREPIEREKAPKVPAPSWVKYIPSKYRKEMGITDKYLDKRTGKIGWAAPAKLVYALGVLPGPIAFGNRMATESERPGQSKTAKTAAYFGPRVRQNDPLTVRINRAIEEKKKVDKELAGLAQEINPANGLKISAANPTDEYRKKYLHSKKLGYEISSGKLKRGDKDAVVPRQRVSSSSGKIKVPGASAGKIKVPGAGAGRIKVP